MTPQERAENPLQKQEGGSHYKNCRIQPVEYIHANGMGYIEGAVIKYVTRHKQKNGAEDIRKAIHFLELLLQLEYEDARETARAAFTPVQEEVEDLNGLMPREYPFAFPPALKWMGKPSLEYVTKLREEVKEVADAARIEDAVEEMFDVIHVAETGIRTCCEYAGLDAGAIRDAVERKNRVRGYYEPQG